MDFLLVYKLNVVVYPFVLRKDRHATQETKPHTLLLRRISIVEAKVRVETEVWLVVLHYIRVQLMPVQVLIPVFADNKLRQISVLHVPIGEEFELLLRLRVHSLQLVLGKSDLTAKLNILRLLRCTVRRF